MVAKLFDKIKWGLLITILALAYILGGAPNTEDEEQIGVDLPGAQWFNFDRFTGWQTKSDPNKVSDGANPQGQNTSINNGDRISIRDIGYEIFPSTDSASSTVGRITSMHTFRKRSGENILMRAHTTVLEWYDENQDAWETLKSGYTEGYEFGFADYNITSDQNSYVYFGNSQQDFSRWTGSHTNLNGAVTAGAGTITVDSTADFPSSGTIVFCGTEVTYSGKNATQFTGAASAPDCDDNKGVAQAVQTYSGNPKGNLYILYDNRLFIGGITSTPQAVYFSEYGVATNFVGAALITVSTAANPGIFNLGEGGGPVTAMAQDENALYIFKRSIIYKVTLGDSAYTIAPLKPFDGKSQTTGAVNQKSVFAGGNGIFFITPDNQIMNLTRVDSIDYPQIIPISDIIKPTTDAAVFTSSTGIYWKDKAYISAKTDSTSNINDVVFVYNQRLQAWDSPIVGWNAEDFSIYDGGEGEELYFGHSQNPNTYKVTDGALDDIHGVSANWRSKQFDFGAPYHLKEIENVFIEGYISDNTTLSISLLLDDNGVTQTYTTNLLGTETGYLFNSPSFNLFGFEAFGVERFGSNDDQSGKKKFRVYLNKNFRRVPFYNAQIEFASDGESQEWEVLRYGFQVREHSQPELRSIYRTFQ